MAFITDTRAAHNDTPSLLSRIGARLSRAMERMVEAQGRNIEIRRAMEMTDEQLAARGMTRDTIVQHVYRDIYYL